MSDTLSSPKPSPTPTGKPVVAATPCSDCGAPTNGTVYMHSQVAGDYRYVCGDCLEEANLMERIYVEPCPECMGSGTTVEGWDCEWCDGWGDSEF